MNAYLVLGLGKEGGLSKSEMLLGIEIEGVWFTSVLPRGHFLKGRYLLFDFGTNIRKQVRQPPLTEYSQQAQRWAKCTQLLSVIP